MKKQFARIMVVAGLAVMTTGISQAGGCSGCCWCGSPKAVSQTALSQPVAAQHSGFSFLTFWKTLLAFI